ncbi:MAG: GlsB/YeaQ/YmgE family stress response membrane protein [Gemmatimonadales bacterium]
MGFLWTLIIGLVVGAIAKLLMPGKDPGGIIVTMLIGVAGALLAGFLGRALGWYSDPGQAPGIIASIIGAMLLLLLYRLFTGRRGSAIP